MQSNTLLRCPSHRQHDRKQIEQHFGESHSHIQDVEHKQIEQHFVMSRLTVAQGAANAEQHFVKVRILHLLLVVDFNTSSTSPDLLTICIYKWTITCLRMPSLFNGHGLES